MPEQEGWHSSDRPSLFLDLFDEDYLVLGLTCTWRVEPWMSLDVRVCVWAKCVCVFEPRRRNHRLTVDPSPSLWVGRPPKACSHPDPSFNVPDTPLNNSSALSPHHPDPHSIHSFCLSLAALAYFFHRERLFREYKTKYCMLWKYHVLHPK